MSPRRQISFPRSCGVVRFHGPFSARRAAATALSTSSAAPRGAEAISLPVAGSYTGKVSPEAACTQSAPISIEVVPSVYFRALSDSAVTDIARPSVACPA